MVRVETVRSEFSVSDVHELDTVSVFPEPDVPLMVADDAVTLTVAEDALKMILLPAAPTLNVLGTVPEIEMPVDVAAVNVAGTPVNATPNGFVIFQAPTVAGNDALKPDKFVRSRATVAADVGLRVVGAVNLPDSAVLPRISRSSEIEIEAGKFEYVVVGP